jgi:hypothetical protein
MATCEKCTAGKVVNNDKTKCGMSKLGNDIEGEKEIKNDL